MYSVKSKRKIISKNFLYAYLLNKGKASKREKQKTKDETEASHRKGRKEGAKVRQETEWLTLKGCLFFSPIGPRGRTSST